jgi:flagellar hook-associated protein 3 FlgL
MRITDSMTYRMLRSNISTNQRTLHKLQEQIASGRKISLPSDGAGAYEVIQRLRKDLSGMDQYAQNAQRVDGELLIADNAMQTMLSLFQRASELAVAAGDGTHAPAALQAMGKEVDEILGSLIDLGNTSTGGRYIFSGTETFTEPFETTTENGFVTAVAYQGNDDVRYVEVSRGVMIEANVPGADAGGSHGLFQTAEQDLFDTLIRMRDRLLAGESTHETSTLDEINGTIDHIANQLSANGARRQRIQLSSEMLNQHQINVQKALEREESVDMAEAITHLSQSQLAYESALQVTARIMNQPTLLNWM